MKELLIYGAGAFAVIQTLLLLAVMGAAARPAPRFEPETEPEPEYDFEFETDEAPEKREEEFALVS